MFEITVNNRDNIILFSATSVFALGFIFFTYWFVRDLIFLSKNNWNYSVTPKYFEAYKFKAYSDPNKEYIHVYRHLFETPMRLILPYFGMLVASGPLWIYLLTN